MCDTAHQRIANNCLSGLFWSLPAGNLPGWEVFLGGMEIFVYSDESGVFDYKHRKYFVMAGIVFDDKQEMDSMIRRYKAAEKNLRKKRLYKNVGELKAAKLSFDDRRNLFHLTSECDRFAFIINMEALNKKHIFANPESKQRYLDWAFKVGLKKLFTHLIARGSIIPGNDIKINCIIDEHSTATNGLYGLEQAIFREFHEGTLNYEYGMYHKPILKESNLSVRVKYVNSEAYEMVRAADIIANRILFEISAGDISSVNSDTLCLRFFPYDYNI